MPRPGAPGNGVKFRSPMEPLMNLRNALCIVIALSFSSGLALAKKETPASAPASKPASKPAEKSEFKLKGIWAMMNTAVTFTDDQLAKVKEKVQSEQLALEPLEKKKKDAEAAVKAAEASGDKDALKTAREDKKKIQADIDHIASATMADVVSLLTPPQKELWAAHNLFRITKQRLSKHVELTEAQDTKIKDLAKEPAKQMVDLKDEKTITQIEADFMKKVKADVLTDEQRKALEAATQPAKDKPAKK